MIEAIARWLSQNYEVFRVHKTGDHLNVYINGLPEHLHIYQDRITIPGDSITYYYTDPQFHQKLHKTLGDRIWKRRKIPRLL